MSAEQSAYEYWLGSRETKYSASGVERSVKPSVTIRRARARLDAIGVTKVSDITDLDRVGMPNFMTVRPRDLGPGLSYYNGKGRTRADAHAGALMEAVERDELDLSRISPYTALLSGIADKAGMGSVFEMDMDTCEIFDEESTVESRE